MNTKNTKHNQNNGRNKKLNPTIHRYVFWLNDEDNAKFLSLFEQSGMKVKPHFITSVLFSKEIKSVKIDKSVMDFYIKLTEFYGQFWAAGVNYNQIAKILYRNFFEKKAAAYL